MRRTRQFAATVGVGIVLLCACPSVMAAGEVLSWFNTDATDIYGMDIREATGTELHLMTGDGSVFSYRVDSASSVKNGTQASYNSKSRMTSSGQGVLPLRGLAILPTNEGAYSLVYIAIQDNLTQYRSRWGVDGNPGSQTWGMINGAWSLNMDGDITPASRTTQNCDIWSVYGSTIYRYPYAPWVGQNAYTAHFAMPKALRGISLGSNSDLWVLCQDGEILNVSSSTGAINKRFFLPAAISSPWGIAYDSGEGSLWISNRADNRIYQVGAVVTWQINTQNALDPLTFTAPNGNMVHPTVRLGPSFVKPDGSTVGPNTYTATVLSSSVVDGYTVLQCRASVSGFSATYKLKFRELAPEHTGDPSAMEILAEADPGDPNASGYVAAASFVPGTFQANNVKQFYTGERSVEAFPGNFGQSGMIYWPTGGMYFYALADGAYSNATGGGHSLNPKNNFLVSNPPLGSYATYDPLSNGRRTVLKERYVIRASANLWNAYGPMTNNPSEYRNELSEMVFFDDWCGSFTLGRLAMDWLKDVAGEKMNFYTIVQGWASGGFDTCNPDAYRIPDHNTPASQFGTKDQLLEYIAVGKTAGRIGLRCNYMVATDASWSVQEGLVKKALDGSGVAQWFTDFFSAKPLVDRQEADIAADFATTGVFHDQWTSGSPVNLDANAPGAANPGASTGEIIRQICKSAKTIHQGPMGSESLFVEHLLGEYVDTGDFGIMWGDSRFDFFPEYKLRCLHHLSTFHGMGLGYRFFTGPSDIDIGNRTYFTDDEKLDSYRACEVLYGNGGYLFYIAGDRYGLRKVHALTECFTVGVAQRYYALQPVDYIQYGLNGQWKTFGEILPSAGSLSEVQSWFKQFHVRYANGCHVWVNRNDANLTVTLPDSTQLTLPKSGWVVYTEDGQFVAYTALSGSTEPDPGKRVDFCEDKNRGIKYANPRTASSFKGVTKPTVWYDGQIHFELSNPSATFAGDYLASCENPSPGVHAGDILSYFSSGESQVWGLDVAGIVNLTLHLMTANGQVCSYDVNSVKAVTNGGQGNYDTKTLMMDSSVNLPLRGLALLSTDEGPYAAVYVAGQDNQAQMRSRWGLDGDIGSMYWSLINGAGLLYMSGDITPASRSVDNSDIWCTYSNYIYRYPYGLWVPQSGYTKRFTMPKLLRGVSAGSHNDLWVLCQDREILHISDSSGTILERFYLDGRISQPWGIAYDRKGGLWISNRADNNIYQVAAAGYVTVSGTVTLRDFIGRIDGMPVTIEVRNPGTTTAVETHEVNLDSTGWYSFTTSKDGVYDLAAKASHWIRQTQSNIDTSTNVTVDFSLPNGDANGDSTVNFSDYLLLAQSFGLQGPDEYGDLNGDGVVNFSDYLILSQNFGSGGAVSSEEVAAFQAASADLTASDPAQMDQPMLPCTPLALALLALIGLAAHCVVASDNK